LNEIASRPHFLVILQPNSLNRYLEPGDWLRWEIEHAIDLERRVVPLMAYDFNFKDAAPYLVEKLKALPMFNGVPLSPDLFDGAIERLCKSFLKPVTLPTSGDDYYRKAVSLPKNDSDRQIVYYSEAIRLGCSQLATALNNRGVAYARKQKTEEALNDYTEAINHNSTNATYFANRGNIWERTGNVQKAIEDFGKALDLDPNHSQAEYIKGRLAMWRLGSIEIEEASDIPF